uniref:ATP synthase F0 subunit 6 n=1 Tax=Iheyomytilidicola lauensis TaxID=998671 RepID=UPI001EDD3878|nr:ATP synthase F0 subunit 6 [Iheyomytilidicola lauensis]UJV31457.1 ATP synthase F0 subunit 6 [Iheyomytilidicola lauensis]
MTFDVFSSMDPGLLLLSLMYLMLPILLIPLYSLMLLLKWNPNPTYMFSLLNTMKIMTSQSARTMGKNISSFSNIINILFIILITMNLLGILPYVFSMTSQLTITLPLALTLWLSIVLSSIHQNQKLVFAHFLPSGAPMWLNPFLILIEFISYIVRPLTLAVRITANISTGHVVLSMMGSYNASFFFSSMVLMFLVTLIQTGYILFEMAIALIQAYIFSLLLTLFANDHPA